MKIFVPVSKDQILSRKISVFVALCRFEPVRILSRDNFKPITLKITLPKRENLDFIPTVLITTLHAKSPCALLEARIFRKNRLCGRAARLSIHECPPSMILAGGSCGRAGGGFAVPWPLMLSIYERLRSIFFAGGSCGGPGCGFAMQKSFDVSLHVMILCNYSTLTILLRCSGLLWGAWAWVCCVELLRCVWLILGRF